MIARGSCSIQLRNLVGFKTSVSPALQQQEGYTNYLRGTCTPRIPFKLSPSQIKLIPLDSKISTMGQTLTISSIYSSNHFPYLQRQLSAALGKTDPAHPFSPSNNSFPNPSNIIVNLCYTLSSLITSFQSFSNLNGANTSSAA